MSRTQDVIGAAGAVPASLSPARLLSLLLPVGCFCFAILLGLPGSLYAPDSAHYRLLALGQRALVPAPFSARILGPAIAGWLGRVTGLGVDSGFLALGIVCLMALIALAAGFLWSWKAPVALSAAIFLVPFWVDMFHDYYLPDLLHAVLLAAMLACLLTGRTALAMVLLFPAYLARESTILVAFCLVFACWRRISRTAAALGVLAIVAGGLVSAHYGHGGPASVHQLSGGGYILGKLVWSLFKNVLGLPLWSNTLPECSPVWATSLPSGHTLGAIRMIGLCRPSAWGPGRLLLAWFGIFGLGPAFAFALWRCMLLPGALEGRLWRRRDASSARDTRAALTPGAILVFRFCCIYGLISILMTPLLGASTDRLVEYGWPFYFVVLPWFVARFYRQPGLRPAGLLCLHLVICWLAWFGFKQETTGYVLAGLAVLALNGLGYFLVKQRLEPLPAQTAPW